MTAPIRRVTLSPSGYVHGARAARPFRVEFQDGTKRVVSKETLHSLTVDAGARIGSMSNTAREVHRAMAGRRAK